VHTSTSVHRCRGDIPGTSAMVLPGTAKAIAYLLLGSRSSAARQGIGRQATPK
jgi:hypothetical protein